MMMLDNQFYIAQTQAESFHIVHITGGNPVKLVEDAFLILFADPDAIIR